jgi:hypothetical protein
MKLLKKNLEDQIVKGQSISLLIAIVKCQYLKINYKIQYPYNLMLNDKIAKKKKLRTKL